uniref:Replication initiator protein n=1 Tax=Dulem virus 233 TaxID=3145710 RepID=A0AAU8AUY1_9VIRU
MIVFGDFMACVNPSYDSKFTDVLGRKIPIPCGKCVLCRIDIQKKIIDRLFCSYHSHDCSAFVTFTYDDEHLTIPDGCLNATLSKDDVHKYIDKVQHRIDLPFEYYICGEYGDSFGRPHYHALFFGLDYIIHKKFFEDSWKLGSVKVLPCNPNSFRYVTKYITKNTIADDNNYFDYGIEKPFHKYSRGLGISVFKEHFEEISKKGYFIFHSRQIFVNRYYFNKLCHFTSDLLLMKEQQLIELDRQYSKDAKRFGYDKDTYRLVSLENKANNLLSKELRQDSKFS